jgi:DNA-binding PadR family transcriptional regulator
MGPAEDRRGGGHEHGQHEHGRHGRSRGRPFDYGALRLVVLAMIADAPRHGYELMKAIEERMGGGYSPSPGVIYPTLAWLEDMGYADPAAEGGRKRYRITPEGEAFLTANRAALDEIGARMGRGGGRRDAPAPILEAMEGLKRALRGRFLSAPVDAAAVEEIAAAIRAAAEQVEGSVTTETTETLKSTATVSTPKAARYAAQLCKHFAHKIPAHFEGSDGEIGFGAGTCRLHAEGETLTTTVEGADEEAVARLQDVVGRHLVRFAFREELAVVWGPAERA